MNSNGPQRNASPRHKFFLSYTRQRLAVCACLLAIGACALLWASGNSGAAANAPQDGTASTDGLWQDVAESSIPSRGERQTFAQKYRTVRLNMEALRGLLAKAPLEFTDAANSAAVELTLPLPSGAFARFRVVESPMLEAKTAEQFPDIKNYSGQGVDDPSAMMRCDLTANGFHAIILSTAGTVFISPYAQGDTEHYISYFTHDDTKHRADSCATTEDVGGNLPEARELSSQISNQTINQGFLRTYFLAAAATAEYTQQFRTSPGDSDATLQQRAMGDINTTVMAVNAIYNRDLAVRLTVIGSTAIIFTNAATDGYTSGNPGMLVAENQTILDNVIGSANYDIGHVFDVGNAGGGGAGQGEIAKVCEANQKGRGTTGGRTNFVLAAHEMGHQFGGKHTFNGNAFGACFSLGGNPQRTADSAYEPASGSSIMSYGGTCTDMNGTDDLQNNRDLFFNASSLEQIVAYISSGNGSTCPVVTNTGNNGISMSFSQSIDVPAQTPFQLFVLAQDIDPGAGTPTVSWEEYDLGPASPPNADDGDRPIFRVYPPVAAPTRNFPHLTYILNNDNNPPATYQGNSPIQITDGMGTTRNVTCGFDAMGNPNTCLTGEILPSLARIGDNAMVFKAVARDNDARGGAINIVTARVNIHSDAGPFKITEPSDTAPPDWAQGSTRGIRWLQGNTHNAPINCANVKITLSTDGGQTFPIVLASSTPNDGFEAVFLPEDTPLTTTARVRVESIIEGNSHRFFDISNRNFNIVRLGVTNTANDGPGSLRQAIIDANSDPGLSRITFDIREGFGVETINLTTELPLITAPVIIDGWSQGGAGYVGPPLIQLNGANVSPGFINNGLTISAGNSTVTGLIINRFSGSGIDIRANGGNKIFGCYIGTNANATNVQGNGRSGILIDNTPNNEIGRRVPSAENIIAGNQYGVRITGANAKENEVRNNYIGTNAAGADLGNTLDGILIEGAPLNLIGGTRDEGGFDLPTGNVISGNGAGGGGSDGIEINGAGASGNTIQANLIGLNPPGTAPLHNFGNGILIVNAPNTVIGSGASAGRNVITGTIGLGSGIFLNGAGASSTIIQGNYLGTNAEGTAALPNNSATNIIVESANNQIRGNLISGQGVTGIYLAFGGATGNSITGNYIGTNAAGTAGLNTTGTGIEVRGGANGNTIGGPQAGMGNVISGNATAVFVISSSNTVIQGNYVGTNPMGTAAVPNVVGVVIDGGTNNQVGGLAPAAGNVISANGTGGNDHGIRLANTTGAQVQGNRIGTNAAGTAALGNGGHGIQVFNSTNAVIGGATAAARNIISANRSNGISIGSGSSGTTVHGNYIGTDVNGTANLGNGLPTGAAGIEIGSGGHTIGGTSAGEGNIIAFSGCAGCFGVNNGSGLRVFSAGNRIRGNSIFGNVELGIDLSGGSEGANRVTANDACDADTGPNNLQNFPVLTAANTVGGSTTFTGTLNSTANASFTVDFYANAACDASGNGEGKTYLGSTSVNTDGSCNANINATLPVSLQAGEFVTATATDAAGNTSEFSSCVPVIVSAPPQHIKVSDFDGDGKSDAAVWQGASTHNWLVLRSSTNSLQTQVDWGNASLGDVAVPGDYDGDSKTDFAVWRPAEGNWYIIRSSNGAILLQNWGATGDMPVPGDYDGDLKTDFAVFRPTEGNWYVLKNAGGASVQGWGTNGDKPVPGDYDNDGKTDFAVFRPAEGNWYILRSTGGNLRRNWGVASDNPAPADYDGDGATDLAVWRSGDWYIINSGTGMTTIKNWGTIGDKLVPADYDGDGRADIAVWRPSEGNWYIIKSTNGNGHLINLGVAGDVPAPSTYLPQ